LQPKLFLKAVTENVEKDNENELLIKPEWLEVRALEKGECYESPKKEIVSCTFKYLIKNLESYNGVQI